LINKNTKKDTKRIFINKFKVTITVIVFKLRTSDVVHMPIWTVRGILQSDYFDNLSHWFVVVLCFLLLFGCLVVKCTHDKRSTRQVS